MPEAQKDSEMISGGIRLENYTDYMKVVTEAMEPKDNKIVVINFTTKKYTFDRYYFIFKQTTYLRTIWH